VKIALAVGFALAAAPLMLAISPSAAGAGERSVRLAQTPQLPIQASAACYNNCNNQYGQCTRFCSNPTAPASSPVTTPLTANPIQCNLNCTTQQQACWATCR
jgi:hypothetical protein